MECLLRLQAWRSYTETVFLRFFCVYYCTCWIKETQPQKRRFFFPFATVLHRFPSASVSQDSTSGARCISMMRCHRSAGAKHTIINYTRIFQLRKICAFSPKKPYQKADILHIWKIQVQRCDHGSRHNRLSGYMTILLCNVFCIFLSTNSRLGFAIKH